MKQLITELSAIPGVSGRESEVREFIISKIKDVSEYSVDALGNLLVMKKGKRRPSHKVMLAAHMDEVGLIISYITEDGFLKFAPVGRVLPRVLMGRPVLVGSNAVPGAIGVKPVHLLKEDEKKALPETDSLYIDIGAFSREEARGLVKPGDTAVFCSNPVSFGDGFMKGRALDDRVGCAVLVEMIRGDLEFDTWFAFTVQEEVGLRGAKTAAFQINPDYAIVVETTTAADIPGVNDEKRVCLLGEGPAVSFMDRSTTYDHRLYQTVMETAAAKGIKAQPKTVVAGGNDAGVIHTSRAGVRTLTVSVPCRYLHSASCVIKESDAAETAKLVKALATQFADA